MKIPDKIKVCGFEFKVILKKMSDSSKWGVTDFKECEIYIENYDTNPQRIEETLLHEILHIISYSVALNLDEDNITRLSTALYQVLKDNHLIKEDR